MVHKNNPENQYSLSLMQLYILEGWQKPIQNISAARHQDLVAQY